MGSEHLCRAQQGHVLQLSFWLSRSVTRRASGSSSTASCTQHVRLEPGSWSPCCAGAFVADCKVSRCRVCECTSLEAVQLAVVTRPLLHAGLR